jgi:hypothetical protein
VIAENQSLAFIVHHNFLAPIHRKNEKANAKVEAAAVKFSLSSCFMRALTVKILSSARLYLCRVLRKEMQTSLTLS